MCSVLTSPICGILICAINWSFSIEFIPCKPFLAIAYERLIVHGLCEMVMTWYKF